MPKKRACLSVILRHYLHEGPRKSSEYSHVIACFLFAVNDRPPLSSYLLQHAEHATALVSDLSLQRNIVVSNIAASGTTTFHTVINSSIQTANIAIDLVVI